MQGHDAMHLSVQQGDTETAAVLLQHSARNQEQHVDKVHNSRQSAI